MLMTCGARSIATRFEGIGDSRDEIDAAIERVFVRHGSVALVLGLNRRDARVIRQTLGKLAHSREFLLGGVEIAEVYLTPPVRHGFNQISKSCLSLAHGCESAVVQLDVRTIPDFVCESN